MSGQHAAAAFYGVLAALHLGAAWGNGSGVLAAMGAALAAVAVVLIGTKERKETR